MLLPADEVSVQSPDGDFRTTLGSLIWVNFILIIPVVLQRNFLMSVIVNVDEAHHALVDQHGLESVGLVL
jgi:hypothetical protein